jgi:hypothetical protein
MKKEDYKTADWFDAKQQERETPTTFKRTSEDDIMASVKERDPDGLLWESFYAKVCAGNERFWVLTTHFLDGEFFGYIHAAELMNTAAHGLRAKDKVRFKSDHIFNIEF